MKNVALVVLDTLRKDSFDEFFDWLPGQSYENAWAPSSWTIPVHGSMFSGKYPSETGVHIKNEFMNFEEKALAEHLRDEGYTTKAYSCNPCISDTFNFDRGFEHFDGNWRQLKRDPDIFDWNSFITENSNKGPIRYFKAINECVTSDVKTASSIKFGARLKLRDMGFKRLAGMRDSGAQSALEYVESTEFDRAEFLFMNLMEAHAPYDPPKEYRTTDASYSPSLLGTIGGTNADPKELRKAYEDSVRYLSDKYREIFDSLSEDFDVIVTLGDHGEMFGEEGIWGHAHGLHPHLTHVPLSIYTGEGEGEVERIDEVVSLIDVHKTVLDLAGIDAESRGQNLLADLESRGYITERFGLNERRRKSLKKSGISEVDIDRYDNLLRGLAFLEGGYSHECLEGLSLWNMEEDVDPEMRMEDAIKDLDVRDVDEKTGEDLSATVMDQLEDLGYA